MWGDGRYRVPAFKGLLVLKAWLSSVRKHRCSDTHWDLGFRVSGCRYQGPVLRVEGLGLGCFAFRI